MPDIPHIQNQTPPPANASSETQITPELPALKKKTPWLLLVLFILLFSVIGVMGYKYYEVKQQLDNQQPSVPSLSPQVVTGSPTPMSSLTTEPNPTADWETYINEEYGFEFKYPPLFDTQATKKQLTDYNKTQEKESGRSLTKVKFFSIYAEKDGTNTAGEPIRGKTSELSGFVRKDDKGKTLEELKTRITSDLNEGVLDGYLGYDPLLRFVDINGVQAIRYIKCGMFCTEIVTIPVQNDYIEIQLYSISSIVIDVDEIDFMLDQILSTFRFLDE